MERKVVSRRERERLWQKEEILTAALKLFSAKGFHNVSMREIAEESEFSIGSLYNFFESKESLFSELMRSCVCRTSEILLPTLNSKDNEKRKISAYIQAHRQILETNYQAIKLYFSKSMAFNMSLRTELSEKVNQEHRRVLEKLSEVFASGMGKGIFRNLDSWSTTLLFSAMLESLVFGFVEDSDETSIDDRISEIESLFFYGILNSTDTGNDV